VCLSPDAWTDPVDGVARPGDSMRVLPGTHAVPLSPTPAQPVVRRCGGGRDAVGRCRGRRTETADGASAMVGRRESRLLCEIH
jgi:hypothetical protein